MATIQTPRAESRVAPAQPPSAAPVRRRRPGHLGSVNVVQIMVLEAALLLAMSVLRHTLWILLVGALGVVVILMVAFGRRRGRWWTEYAALRLRYRRRRRGGHASAEDRRIEVLRGLVPELTVHDVEGHGGLPVGLGYDGAGWFAVLAVTAANSGAAQASLPVEALTSALRAADQPGAVLQIVTLTVPVGNGMASGAQPSTASYRELVKSVGGPLAADQVSWVSVRLDARTLAEVAAGTDDVSSEAPVVLAALVRQAGKTLRRAGLKYQILDANGLMDALLFSLDLDPVAPVRPLEHWNRWQSTRWMHATFWVRDWPALAACPAQLGELAGTHAAATSIATVVEPHEEGVDVWCLVRVAADPTILEHACAELIAMALAGGTRLFRLDGEQGPAVYASAPSGGGAL